ncbi:4-amino-4-deoxy-L-arabinose-phosphoundecaprenol flippase subunit ArnF [Rouxiella sp. WC2420]|uniref:Probable 4-amino-4-deoxy-L-arabinose-phosphoundecaprenol flippase subunit ArnF n=1 Tax=Rouxiella sp. WC2420 TaxID=3234145 RepID=A0AB39VN85_9GAMM
MKGYAWGVASLMLVSAAQLLMKWGMSQMPTLSLDALLYSLIMNHLVAVFIVCCGIAGYALSMVCWFFALRELPLNRAYSLLSLSYAVVYLAAVWLPWFHENMHPLKSLGALSILLGVWLINSKSGKAAIK